MHCEQRLLPLNGTLTTQSARFEGYQLANETILHSLDATPLPTSLASCSPPPSIVPSTVAPGLNNNNNYDEYLQLRWHNWHLVSRRQQLIPHQQGMLFVDGPNGHLYRIDNAQDGQQQMSIICTNVLQIPPGDPMLHSLLVLSPSLLLYSTGLEDGTVWLIDSNQDSQRLYTLQPTPVHISMVRPFSVLDAQLIMREQHRLHVELLLGTVPPLNSTVNGPADAFTVTHLAFPLPHNDSRQSPHVTVIGNYSCVKLAPQFCRLNSSAVWIISQGAVTPSSDTSVPHRSTTDVEIRGPETEEERRLLAREASERNETTGGNTAHMHQQLPPPPPAFSWTQTGQDLTIYYPLDSIVDKSLISIQFHRSHISVQLPEHQMHSMHKQLTDRLHWKRHERLRMGAHPSLLLLSTGKNNNSSNDANGGSHQPQTFFSYPLYGPLRQESCYWTVEHGSSKQHGKTFSILTLHLEKDDHGTRWPCVFHHPTVDEDVLNVPESLDPNELSEILEQMEKYTAPPNSSFAITADTTNMTTTAHPQTMQQIADFVNKRRAEEESLLWETVATEPPSLSEQPAGPSLFQRNQLTIDDDDECDLESQGVRVYRFSRTANSPTICYNSHSDSYLGQRMLSLQHSSRHAPSSVGIQHNVDMFEFELEPQLKHCAVCPAIGFVQASKRTKRCILYTEWFVFIVDQRKLIFIYRRGATSSWQPQAIVDLSAVISGPPESLDILGLQQINDWQFMGLTSTHCFTLTLKQQAMNF